VQPAELVVGVRVDVAATTVAAVLAEPSAAEQAVATNQETAGGTQVLVPRAAPADVEPADATGVVATDEAANADAAIVPTGRTPIWRWTPSTDRRRRGSFQYFEAPPATRSRSTRRCGRERTTPASPLAPS